MLLETLRSRALDLGLIEPEDQIDAGRAFLLVRDMRYARASSREPALIIAEWRGTCSGKHYLLRKLFAELGYSSRLIAYTTVAHLDPRNYQGQLRELLEESNGRFVDVHNYLILELAQGDMIVDATWPITAKGTGAVVNEHFTLGENQKIASSPIRSWVVPGDRDPQDFKDEILKESFSPQELAHREAFITAVSALSMAQ